MIMLDNDGTMFDPYTAVPDPESTDGDHFRRAVRAGLGRKGARIGGQGDEPDLFRTDMLAFHTAQSGAMASPGRSASA